MNQRHHDNLPQFEYLLNIVRAKRGSQNGEKRK